MIGTTVTDPGRLATFLRRACADQTTVGAVAPTSRAVSERLADLLPPRPVTLVELGAGTGAISAVLARRLAPGSRHLALECDAAMVPHLRAAAPGADVVCGRADELLDLPGAPAPGSVDVVLSALPWTRFPPSTQRRLLAVITAALADDGIFSTIAYRPTRGLARPAAFRGRLEETFGDVVTTSCVWRNLPPARLHVARRPRRAGVPGPERGTAGTAR